MWSARVPPAASSLAMVPTEALQAKCRGVMDLALVAPGRAPPASSACTDPSWSRSAAQCSAVSLRGGRGGGPAGGGEQ